MKITVLYDGRVGLEIADYLWENYKDDLHSFTLDDYSFEELKQFSPYDFIILAWWPRIVPPEVLGLATRGVVNTHNSLLPFNRGKHPNFWSLVEGTPYGVTLHLATNKVDSGDVLAQQKIPTDWTDTGGTLYARGLDAIIELFRYAWPAIRNGTATRRPQGPGPVAHSACELEDASEIQIDGVYSARRLLNLLRARTFPGQPACWFVDGGETYEVRVNISKGRTPSATETNAVVKEVGG